MDPTEEVSRRYVDLAMTELGVQEISGRSFELANRAAALAMREALTDAQPMVSRLVECAGLTGMAAGFDVAVAAIERRPAGFGGADTRETLEALVRDLAHQKFDLLRDSGSHSKSRDV